MATKLTKAKLELAEKKLELQERRAILKESKEKIELDKNRFNLEIADQLRWALSTTFIKNEGEGLDNAKEYGFSDEQFLYLIKKYFNILKEL